MRDINPVVVAAQYSVLERETRHREALFKINAGGNLAVGLIARAASAPDQKALRDTDLFLGEVATLMAGEMAALDELPGAVSLRLVADDLLAHGTGEDNLLALRAEQLANMEAGSGLVLQ